jgi:hypothetical protein
VTRVHLTGNSFLSNFTGKKELPEEPSTRCSFTDTFRSIMSDLDPRSPIYISVIPSDITLPLVITQAGYIVSNILWLLGL